MASWLGAVYSGSSGVGLSPAGDIVLCCVTLTMPLSVQVYKWVSAIIISGETVMD